MARRCTQYQNEYDRRFFISTMTRVMAAGACFSAGGPGRTRASDSPLARRSDEGPVPARNLGAPITTANRWTYTAAHGFGENGHDVLCWATSAESGGHFFAMDLTTGKVVTHPLNSLEAYTFVLGSDRNIYLSSSSGEVMRWEPRTNRWGPLGKPLFTGGWPAVRTLCEGRDEWLYAGSPDGRRARIHLKSAEVQSLPETAERGYWYVDSVAALPDGRVAFGYGHKARLFVYDPEAGKDAGQWLPAGWTEDGFIITLTMGRSVLYAVHMPSGRRAAFDARTGRFLDKVPWPDHKNSALWSKWTHIYNADYRDFYLLPGTDTIVACDGEQVYQYDPLQRDLPPVISWDAFKPPPELALEMRHAVTTDCRVVEYDERRLKVIRTTSTPQPKVSRYLYSLGLGPDGNVYGGAFQSMLLFACDPQSGTITLLGDHHPGWSGEIYSYTIWKDELICASYTHGAIVAYNPAKPWHCEPDRMLNPRLLGFLGQRVYRPFSSCVAEDGKIWSVGAAGWGTTGGGVAYLDPVTRNTEATALPESPDDVIALPGKRLLLASGGLLRWWDTITNKEIAQVVPPVPLVSATPLESGPSPRVLLASGNELLLAHVSEPGKVEVITQHMSPVPCQRALIWKGQAVVGGPKGFATVDLKTGAPGHFCSTPLGLRWAFVVTAAAVHFSDGGNLMRADIPKADGI